jgi:hypothetical protein
MSYRIELHRHANKSGPFGELLQLLTKKNIHTGPVTTSTDTVIAFEYTSIRQPISSWLLKCKSHPNRFESSKLLYNFSCGAYLGRTNVGAGRAQTAQDVLFTNKRNWDVRTVRVRCRKGRYPSSDVSGTKRPYIAQV